MSAERLRRLLEQVRAELETTDSIDDEGRELLVSTMEDLAHALERSGSEQRARSDESLRERLEDAARQFETEHPQLFTMLQQLAASLGGAGI